MRELTVDELILLPEEQALQQSYDQRNFRLARWMIGCATPVALVAFLYTLTSGKSQLAVLWGLNIALLLVLYLSRRTRYFASSFRQILLVYVVAQLVVWVLAGPDHEFRVVLAGFLFPLVIPFLRLRWTESLLLAAVAFATTVWLTFQPGIFEDRGEQVGLLVGVFVWLVLLFWISRKIAAVTRERFEVMWRREVSRDREQSRMREELNDARQVQLSMLPKEPPAAGWIEFSTVTLPASEVGGDYYDYVPLDADRIAVVVGDVAGHGMSSGLLLAAVRGGLHLLRDELGDPKSVLERLDRMVREVAPRRMYMTLQIAILDRARSQMSLVNAGHPRALLWSNARQEVLELGAAALPLGVQLDSTLQEETAALESGDVLVFYTDGVPELTDLRSDAFGQERLIRTVRRAATGHSARQIRDSILDAITHFKGDVELRDDLTLLVAKMR